VRHGTGFGGLRRAGLLLAGLMAVGLSGSSRAQMDMSAPMDAPGVRWEPPHEWTLEIRASSVYYPDADTGFPEQPFHAVFGPKHRWLAEIQIDHDVWKKFGTISVGFATGYAEFYGHGFVEDATLGLVQVADRASFHEIPFRLLATYRFDPYVPRGIPLVPFVRVGLDWYYYWASLGSGQISIDPATGAKGQGLTSGFEGTIGLEFLLDTLDPHTAASFYHAIGVAHTYLVAGFTSQVIKNGPGNLVHEIFNGGHPAPPAINLSSTYFDFGLGFQF
jgi:hypothetical protein